MSFFKVWRNLKKKKNYSPDFYGRGPELLEIHPVITGRVGKIRFLETNIFKMLKSTKNIKIHKNHELKAVFFHKK